MKVSAQCFNDQELCAFIDSNGVDGTCDVLGIKSKVVDLIDLSDFLTDLLDIFVYDVTSSFSLIDIIRNDWKLFSSDDVANSILNKAISIYRPKLNINHVSYIEPIAEYVGIWDKLKQDLEFNTRYFINLQDYNRTDPYLTECLKVDDYLHEGEKLYRARVLPDKVSRYKIGEMGCPPKEKVAGGRANPIGIPYLYCELCRMNGADGISFNSSLHHEGMNYVLFCGNNDRKIECKSVGTMTVEQVDIKAL